MALKKTSEKVSSSKVARKVHVDFPQESEQIPQGSYTIRVSAATENGVEVSVNGKTWNECRFTGGYHWFDWQPKKSGRVKIVARIRSEKGAANRSLVRCCFVNKSN